MILIRPARSRRPVALSKRLEENERRHQEAIAAQVIASQSLPPPQTGFQVHFLESDADIAIGGGAAYSGKTYGLLLDFARFCDNPIYRSVIFRRTSPQITNEGGLFDTAGELFPPVGATPHLSNHEYRFRSGATIRFAHLQHERNKYDWQGAQLDRCVGKGTLIQMADGRLMPVEEIHVGDRVETLQGPRVVTHTPPPIKKKSYRILGEGIDVIVGEDHRFLTDRGWVSPMDLRPSQLHAPCNNFEACFESSRGFQLQSYEKQKGILPANGHPSQIQQDIPESCVPGSLFAAHTEVRPMRSPLLGNSGVFSMGLFVATLRLYESQWWGPPQPVLPAEQTHLHIHLPLAIAAFSKANHIGSAKFDDERQVMPPPLRLSCRLVQAKPFLQSKRQASPVLYPHCAQGHADDALELQGCPIGCQFYNGFCDEQSGQGISNVPESTRQPSDAAESTRSFGMHKGETDNALLHSHLNEFWHDHPYKKGKQKASCSVWYSGDIYVAPVGVQECFDLRVQGASHYLDSNGVVHSNCGWDELTHFTESQFFYMLSRVRSPHGLPTKIRATTNPDAESWVAKFISWWISDQGYPDPAKSGKIRWFVRLDGELVWGDSWDDLHDRYPDLVSDPGNYLSSKISPLSVTFIPGSIQDNQRGLESDPTYMAKLMSLHPVERDRLLYGNWHVKFIEGTVFKRHWFTPIEPDLAPRTGRLMRFWDIASTEKKLAKDSHFYTAGIKMRRSGDRCTVQHGVWDQVGPSDVEDLIINTAKADGRNCLVRFELEGGSNAMIFAENLKKKLRRLGINANYVKPKGDKLARAMPYATAASNNTVEIVEGDWTEEYLDSIQRFSGASVPKVTDITDASSGCYNELFGNAIAKGKPPQPKQRNLKKNRVFG